VDVVLREHGFTLADLVAWGGEISYDQPMPNHPSRIGRLKDGELDAIFDEGVIMWADQVTAAGARLLPISPAQLDALTSQGFRPAVIEHALDHRLVVPAALKRMQQCIVPLLRVREKVDVCGHVVVHHQRQIGLRRRQIGGCLRHQVRIGRERNVARRL